MAAGHAEKAAPPPEKEVCPGAVSPRLAAAPSRSSEANGAFAPKSPLPVALGRATKRIRRRPFSTRGPRAAHGFHGTLLVPARVQGHTLPPRGAFFSTNARTAAP